MTEPLMMHYDTSGILAVLKTERCPGQKGGWGSIQHSTCGCHWQHCHVCNKEIGHIRYRIANITVLQPGETGWVLDQCLLVRHAEQTLTGQTDG